MDTSPRTIITNKPDHTPIEEVAGGLGLEPLGRNGWFNGPCPRESCEDKHESFYLYPPGHYHCYSCGCSGELADLQDTLADEHTSLVSFVREPHRWPVLADEAFYGLAGDIVRSIEPHTEADPVAVLVNLLAAFGSAAGRGAFFRVGADTHYLKLNVGLVGETSKGRKGQSWGHVRELMHATDGKWAEERVLHGLSSGEGLIYAVRDRQEGENKDGERVVIDAGVDDKRLLVMEAELASVLKVMSREGNTLSPVIRQAWDGERLQVMTRNNPMKATGAHVAGSARTSRSYSGSASRRALYRSWRSRASSISLCILRAILAPYALEMYARPFAFGKQSAKPKSRRWFVL